MCLCYKDVSIDYFNQSKVPEQLVAYISFQSDIIIGPALIALVHLSLHDDLKPVITAQSNFHVYMLNILVKCKSKVILALACKLLASLARHSPNKVMIVNSGCVHAIIDLLQNADSSNTNDFKIQYYSLAFLCNLIYGNDSTRVLAVELKTVGPVLSTMRTSSNELISEKAAHVLANISFNNNFTGGTILAVHGDNIIVEALRATDFLRSSANPIATSLLSSLTNLCSIEVNQSHICLKEGFVECMLRIVEHSRDVSTVAHAAKTVLALIW